MLSFKDLGSDEQLIEAYKQTPRGRADYLWIYRLLMIPIHVIGNFWLCYFYGSQIYLQYMSYFSIGFNLMYFIFGFLSISVSHLRYRSMYTQMFKIWYSIAHPSAWIVTILYWTYIFGLMVPSLETLVFSKHLITSIVGHIFNLVLLQFDLFLCTLNLKVKYFVFPLITFIIYELMLIYDVAVKEQHFPYDFVDTNYRNEQGIKWGNLWLFITELNCFVIFFYLLTLKICSIRDILYSRSSKGYSPFESSETLFED